MFVGQFKNADDERQKRINQKELLKLMILNESRIERKVKDYQNPFSAPEVPPQYKTRTERRNDSSAQEAEALGNIQSLFDFDVRGINKVMNSIRTTRGNDGVIIFNALFPQIRNKIVNDTNPKLLTPAFVGDIIREFIIRNEDTNPLTRMKGENISKSIDDLEIDYNEDIINKLIDLGRQNGLPSTQLSELAQLQKFLNGFSILIERMKGDADMTKDELEQISKKIRTTYKKLGIPTLAQLRKAESSKNPALLVSKLNANVKGSRVDGAMKRLQEDLDKDLEKMLNEELLQDAEEQGTRGGDIPRTYQETEADKSLAEKVISMTGSIGGVEETKEDLDVPEPLSTKVRQASDEDFGSESEESEETESSVSAEESGGAEEPDEIDTTNQIELMRNAEILGNMMKLGYSNISPEGTKINETKTNEEKAKLARSRMLKYVKDNISNAKFKEQIIKEFGSTERYNSFDSKSVKNNTYTIQGMTSFAYKVLKAKSKAKLENKIILADSISGYKGKDRIQDTYGDEVNKKGYGVKKRDVRLSRHQEELQVQGQLDQLPRVSFKKRAGRPSVKIGKGIDIQVPQDNYKTFGKHLIHYPALRDDYKMSVKYPSRSKNVGKIIVVSPDYREMIMDLLERGALSDRLYDKLSNDEKKHFNQAVKASGLIETLKLKPIDEDKKDLVERFKVLRGEFIAGNDAPSMLKELRALVLHFMESGQIPKTQGYDLLKELSAVEK
jgi:hypothetical protein